MHSGSNKDINLCSNFVVIFLITVFIAHQETKDSYDFVIVMDGRSIVSPPEIVWVLNLAPHVASHLIFLFNFQM